jgi:hypothetical protein
MLFKEISFLVIMHGKLFAILFMVIWFAVTFLALLWGFTYNWPDNVHVNYGLPLTWATNTLSTFSGPVNLWSVNVSDLFVDLVLWLGTMIAAVAVILYKLKP